MGIKADLKILKVYKDKVYLVTPQTYAESFKGETKASDILRYFQGKRAYTLLANESHDLQTTVTSPASQLRESKKRILAKGAHV